MPASGLHYTERASAGHTQEGVETSQTQFQMVTAVSIIATGFRQLQEDRSEVV